MNNRTPVYPLLDHAQNRLTSFSGKPVSAITLQAILNNQLTVDDARISAANLELQAQIAESEGRHGLAENFRRAAELTALTEETILQIYNALRPNRSTRKELEAICTELEYQRQAPRTAALVREALETYDKRNCLRKD